MSRAKRRRSAKKSNKQRDPKMIDARVSAVQSMRSPAMTDDYRELLAENERAIDAYFNPSRKKRRKV